MTSKQTSATVALSLDRFASRFSGLAQKLSEISKISWSSDETITSENNSVDRALFIQ